MRLSFSLFLLVLATQAATTTTTAFVIPHKTLSFLKVSTPATPSSSSSSSSSSTRSTSSRLYYSSSATPGNDDDGKGAANPIHKAGGYLERIESAFGKAQVRLENLKMELQQDKSQGALEAVQERMKNQESQLTDKLEYYYNIKNCDHQVVPAVIKVHSATAANGNEQSIITESISQDERLLPKELRQLLVTQFKNEQARMKQQSNKMLMLLKDEASSSKEEEQEAQDRQRTTTTTTTTTQQTHHENDDKGKDDQLRRLHP